MTVKVEPGRQQQPSINIQQKPLSRAKAIQICQEKYPSEFKRKKILTLAIAIGAIAVLVIPAIATGLAALSVCSFGVGLLIVTPIALLAISILIKKIDDRTQYWTGKLAMIIVEKKEEEAREEVKKAHKVDVKQK